LRREEGRESSARRIAKGEGVEEGEGNVRKVFLEEAL